MQMWVWDLWEQVCRCGCGIFGNRYVDVGVVIFRIGFFLCVRVVVVGCIKFLMIWHFVARVFNSIFFQGKRPVFYSFCTLCVKSTKANNFCQHVFSAAFGVVASWDVVPCIFHDCDFHGVLCPAGYSICVLLSVDPQFREWGLFYRFFIQSSLYAACTENVCRGLWEVIIRLLYISQ